MTGSSPRVRGTPATAWTPRARPRFIPACAGNTSFARRRLPPAPVHPRVCGEHSFCSGMASCAAGSSPRVRGTRSRSRSRQTGHAVHPRVCGEHISMEAVHAGRTGSSPRVRGTPPGHGIPALRRRFIPACAGNTLPSRGSGSAPAVHPRVCGEHVSRISGTATESGSSPRVRGTRLTKNGNKSLPRFIPACAGNTCRRSGPV